MITFSSPGGSTVDVKTSSSHLRVFGEKGKDSPADITLFSNPDDVPAQGTISWPGEYDMGGLAIRGIGHEEGKYVSYVLDDGHARCAFLCSPLQEWNDHQIELLGNVDVLFVPTDAPKMLQKIIDEIDPRVLVPLDTGGADKHAEALKICGAKDTEAVSEYKLKGSLPAEGREIVVLSI